MKFKYAYIHTYTHIESPCPDPHLWWEPFLPPEARPAFWTLEAKQASWSPGNTAPFPQPALRITLTSLLLITISWPSPKVEACQSIRGQASILITSGQTASWTPNMESTTWKPSRNLLLQQKPWQYMNLTRPPARSEAMFIARTSTPNLGSTPCWTKDHPAHQKSSRQCGWRHCTQPQAVGTRILEKK